MEVMIAVAIIGVAVTALYASMSSGFVVVESARENLRATQIMVEKLETVRLYKWTDIVDGKFDGSFTNFYNHNNSTGFPYIGVVTTEPVTTGESYADEMQQVTVNLSWTSAGVQRTRTMVSLISQKGVQNYVY